MARDKLITIRIEGDKREAFNNLAKSQNTDTASLLYDFISGCLDGRIDIKLVMGKKQWIDKLDNQIGSDRIDKLEATTQRIDNWIGALSERLNDWILRSDQRLTDSDQGLSEKITSLEHRLNALAIQWDSQQIDSIDTDSQKDRQRENPDIEPVATVEIADNVETDYEPVQPAIGPVPGDSIDTEPGKGKGMTAVDATKYLKAKKVKISYDSLNRWINKEKIPDTSPQGRDARKHLILRDGLYYPIN